MKKTLYMLFIALMAMANSGCEALNKEVDWAPISLYIYVQDANGTDLLNMENEGCVASSVTAQWDGESYTLPTQATTRAYKATMSGLKLDKSSGGYFISFGELDGGVKWDNDLIITWGDGSQDTIHLKNAINDITLASERTYSLNGTKCDNPIVIVKGTPAEGEEEEGESEEN